MATEAYLRIPEHRRREDWQYDAILKKIALMLEGNGSLITSKGIAKEGDPVDKMRVGVSSILFEKSSGYKYQVGSSNDFKMDVVDASRGIYLIAYRYGRPKQVREMAKGICSLLNLDYVYRQDFEQKVLEKINPLVQAKNEDLTVWMAQDEIFKETRELIEKALTENRFYEQDLDEEKNQHIVIETMIKLYKEVA